MWDVVQNLGSEVMRNLFLRHKQSLQNTKIQLVHNLNDMDEILSLDLNEHVDLNPEYLTLQGARQPSDPVYRANG
jgi:hypothetical protein